MELNKRRLVFVTGLSGAGKSTALKAFEDSGFETIDNLPLEVIETVVASILPEANLAIGVDSRTRGFDARYLQTIVTGIEDKLHVKPEVIFMDASDTALIQRFSETRRRHPLSHEKPIVDGLQIERKMLDPVRIFASSLFDTTNMSSTDARLLIKDHIGHDTTSMVITVMSFGFAQGVPRAADMVLDVRFLQNPHYDKELKPLTGLTSAVQDFVKADDGFDAFVKKTMDMISFLVPRYKSSGKSYFTIAFGCTGGKHRSVTMAETFSGLLESQGLDIHCWHRDIPK